MTLKGNISDFEKGKINKKTLIKENYKQYHSKLFEYSNLLKKTKIKNILIQDGNVVFIMKEKGIKIVIPDKEMNSVPLNFLNFNTDFSEDFYMVKNLLKNENIFFDIGANLGWHSIVLAKNFLNKKFYCFEPFPNTFSYLKENILLNKCKNINLNNLGFSYQNKKSKFYYSEEKLNLKETKEIKSSYNIKENYIIGMTLDTYCKKNNIFPDFIKCDANGEELSVFFGGKKTIERNKPIVYLETPYKLSKKIGYKPKDIYNFFYDLGYINLKNYKKVLQLVDKNIYKKFDTKSFFLHRNKHKYLINKYSNNN